MTRGFADDARAGRPVYITDVREAFREAEDSRSIDFRLVLPDGRKVKHFTLSVPPLTGMPAEQTEFVFRYVQAEVYNHITTLGGVSLAVYVDQSDRDLLALVNRVVEAFQISRSAADREGVGRVINVMDRMISALHGQEDVAAPGGFEISIHDREALPAAPEPVRFQAARTTTFADVVENLEEKVFCGLDIGGTDIKGVLALHGKLDTLVEYDWNPAAYGDVEKVTDPIFAIARVLRAKASLALDAALPAGRRSELNAAIALALDHPSDCAPMERASDDVEAALNGRLAAFDAIGMCFPDVVVRNRVVGGEVPKTMSMRANPARDFEEQFAQLTTLNVRLGELCADPDAVMNTNDGPMASFTAAVELVAGPSPELADRGVFAHTLGTDLGTGLVLADGSIPEIPLEVYNLIVDLGSDPARSYPARDLRSLANTNTGIQGTLQRITSQAGAFRLADEILASRNPGFLSEIERQGYIVMEEQSGGEALRIVPESPVDQRKPYLAYLMSLAADSPEVAEVFTRIGEAMAVVWSESEHVLDTGLTDRFLFGRFVKSTGCFRLMQEGAARRVGRLRFVPADSEMAYTPLMRQLAAHPEYTVAQFGQAVGAVYFGNLATKKSAR